MRWLTILGLLVLLPSGRAWAQATGEVSGLVTDTAGAPLSGASVHLTDVERGSQTGPDGRYVIADVPIGAHTVEASLVGYSAARAQVTVQPGRTAAASFQLVPQAVQLEGIVAVGYGTQRRMDVTGSVSSVSAREFENRPLTQASQVLEGLAPGVYVNQNSGQPARDAAQIRIRGVGTLGNSNPLVLIDGVEGDLSKLNPQDIQSISVLKDAASAAIYGSRAANGVVLVTTKTGVPGADFRVEYDGYVGASTPTVLPDNVTNSVEWLQLANQAYVNQGLPPRFPQSVIDTYRANSGTDPLLYPNTDWLDVLYDTAPTQEHNLRVSGGTDRVRYALSGGYLKNTGVLEGTDAIRATVRLNLDSDVSSRLHVGTRLNASRWVWQEGPLGTRWTVYETLRAAPFYPATEASGDVYPTTWISNYRGDYRNPLAVATASQLPQENNQVGGQVFAGFKLLPSLTWDGTFSVDRTEDFTQYFVPQLQLQNPQTGQLGLMDLQGPRRVTNDFENSFHRTAFTTLTYDQRVQDVHHVKALLGYQWEADDGRGLYAYREGFPSNALSVINAGSLNQQNSGNTWDWGLISYFGRLNYDLRDRYLFQANFRYDGSSRFAADQRWGFFPSFSAGWVISDEPFMQSVPYLHQLKLRGSWGELGNQQIGNYPYQSVITLGTNYNFNGQVAPGVAVTRLVNQGISWETTKITDVGVDAVLGAFDATVDYFDKKTDGILRQQDIPWFVGALNPPYANLAAVNNRGWEAELGYNTTIGGLRLRLGGNVTRLHNEVTSLPGDSLVGQYSILKVGQPINAWYMLQADGIYQNQAEIDNSPVYFNQRNVVQPGDIRYRDVNGDGTIDASDRMVVGSPIPTWTYGFNASANVGGFDVSALLQGVAGAKTYPSAESAQPFYGDASITKEWLNAWTPENHTNALPRLTTASYAPNFAYSSFWLQDASYLRVKNIQLGYTLPAGLTTHLGTDRVRLYVNAKNAFTFTDVKYVDPERALTDNFIREVPNVRTLSIGTNVSF